MKHDNLWQWFFRLVGTILCVTALLKLWSLTQPKPFLRATDPIFDLPYWVLLIVAGSMEIGVALIVLARFSNADKAIVALGLSLVFATYRLVSLEFKGSYCPCLGSLPEQIGLDHQTTDFLLWSLLLGIAAGSATCLVSELAHHKKIRLANPAII